MGYIITRGSLLLCVSSISQWKAFKLNVGMGSASAPVGDEDDFITVGIGSSRSASWSLRYIYVAGETILCP